MGQFSPEYEGSFHEVQPPHGTIFTPVSRSGSYFFFFFEYSDYIWDTFHKSNKGHIGYLHYNKKMLILGIRVVVESVTANIFPRTPDNPHQNLRYGAAHRGRRRLWRSVRTARCRS